MVNLVTPQWKKKEGDRRRGRVAGFGGWGGGGEEAKMRVHSPVSFVLNTPTNGKRIICQNPIFNQKQTNNKNNTK